MNRRKNPVGRPKGYSGLPAPIAGEPFSLIGTLRRCTRPLSVADVRELTGLSKNAVYNAIKEGKIPPANLGFGEMRIDPKGWALLLEHDNKHLMPSVKAYLQIARAA